MSDVPKSILVRCPNWVGDIVMATPVFESVRQQFPGAEIVAGVRGRAAAILDGLPAIDRIVSFDDKTARGFAKTVRVIRSLRPDIAVLLPNSTRAFVSSWLGGAGRIYGYRRDLRRWLLTDGPTVALSGGKPVPRPMIDYYLEICRYLGWPVPAQPKPTLHIRPELEAAGRRYLEDLGIDGDDTVIGLNPGARFGSSKCWPPVHFARLAELLHEGLGCRLLLLVGPGEDDLAEAIVAQSSAPIINTAPRKADLAILKPVVKRCRVLVTNDTGPRHYAVAFDVPTVVIMGPTDPRYTAANLDQTIVIRRDMACSPCHLKTCPGDHRCMVDITPEEVFDATCRLLA